MKQFPTPWLCEQKHIKSKTNAYALQRVNFKQGRRLGDIYIYDNRTCKKVRRILEKRVAQDYWRNARAMSKFTNRGRYETRHFLSNQFQNIYGLSYQEVRDCA